MRKRQIPSYFLAPADQRRRSDMLAGAQIRPLCQNAPEKLPSSLQHPIALWQNKGLLGSTIYCLHSISTKNHERGLKHVQVRALSSLLTYDAASQTHSKAESFDLNNASSTPYEPGSASLR